MTCIVGIKEKGKVFIGGDSMGSDGWMEEQRKDVKVFRNKKYIFGFTSSFRMGQVLMFHPFKSRAEDDKRGDFEYLVTDFIDEIRDLFKAKGYLEKDKEVETGGVFLLGYKGELYRIDSDFQVGILKNNYTSVGCGDMLALGALFASVGKEPKERIELAIRAATEFSKGVGGEIIIEEN